MTKVRHPCTNTSCQHQLLSNHNVIIIFLIPTVDIRPDDIPNLVTLIKFPGRHRRIDIIQCVAADYQKFGTLLLGDVDGSRMSAIEKTNNLNSVATSKAILEEWLKGRGVRPVSWNTLVQCLQDAEFNTLADDILEVLA